jgi:hypothetical protein
MKRQKLSDNYSVGKFEVLPPDFDWFSATAADIVRYGLPHAKSDVERNLLTKALSRLRGRIGYIAPEFEVLPARPRALARRNNHSTVESNFSQNWAGAVSSPPDGTHFSYVTASFAVPNVSESLKRGGAYGNELFVTESSHWVGIDSATQVCQAGVEVDSIVNKSVAIPYIWAEWFPGPLLKVKNFPVKPGDRLGVLICTNGRSSVDATATFSNFTNGSFTSFQFSAPPGVSLQGETAEWISERPREVSSDGTGGDWPLANFGDVIFCEAIAGADGQGVVPQQADVIEMEIQLNPIILICEAIAPMPGMVRTIWMDTGYVYM